jgi:hypothetical protein
VKAWVELWKATLQGSRNWSAQEREYLLFVTQGQSTIEAGTISCECVIGLGDVKAFGHHIDGELIRIWRWRDWIEWFEQDATGDGGDGEMEGVGE